MLTLAFLLQFAAFRCFLLPVLAPSDFSWLLMLTIFHSSLKLMQVQWLSSSVAFVNKNSLCRFLLLVIVHSGVWCLHLHFSTFKCSRLTVVSEIESILSQTKAHRHLLFAASCCILLLVLSFGSYSCLMIPMLVLGFAGKNGNKAKLNAFPKGVLTIETYRDAHATHGNMTPK